MNRWTNGTMNRFLLFPAIPACMLVAGLVAALAGCTSLTPTEQAAVTAGTTAAVTVASVAAQQNTTVAALVTNGELFCSGATLFAVANTSVIGKSAAAVEAICKAVDGIAVPVSPPAAAASVPVVVAPAG